MKTKSPLSFAATIATALITLSACSDYDNGFTEEKMKYYEDFREAFGTIDPEQDWNLAERGTVSVTTDKMTNVKIYALNGDKYSIVGDYQYVKGTQQLGFDMLEGTTDIIVSDGRSAQKTTVGGSVNFGGTRTVHSPGNGFVTVEKITDDAGVDIGGVTYPKYIYATETELTEMKKFVPEGKTNLKRVSHDFSYRSTGAFVVYPYYWWTSSDNTIGIYYYDDNGHRQMVDIYTIKGGGELEFESITDESAQIVLEEEAEKGHWKNENEAGTNGYDLNTWSTEGGNSGIKTPFLQLHRGHGAGLTKGKIRHNTITGLEAGSYIVQIKARVINERNATTIPSGFTFFANDTKINLSEHCQSGTFEHTLSANDTYTNSELYGDLSVECTVKADGKLDLGFEVGDNAQGNWLAFKNLKVIRRGQWDSTDGKNSFSCNALRGQGIVVNIPAGTVFGMYLRGTTQLGGTRTFYSQSELNNDPTVCGYGVDVDENGNKIQLEGTNPCYASTFKIGDQMFLGFEDWPNDERYSDFDLNDVVLSFSGATPEIMVEQTEEAASWMLACEDLGGSFDIDYNDLVFKVEHVSGRDYALVTPLAAGGTLASYIFFSDPTTNADEICLGEIHQLFGATPATSGMYTPLNVGSWRGTAGTTVKIPVGKDWSMAHYTSDDFDTNQQYKDHNMGGFKVYVLKSGTAPLEAPADGIQHILTPNNPAFGAASIVAAPQAGNVPEMLCIPATYTCYNTPKPGEKTTYEWAWPQELKSIYVIDSYTTNDNPGVYPRFKNWVNDHTQDRDWYKEPNRYTVSSLEWVTPMSEEEKKQVEVTEKQYAMYIQWGQQLKPNNSSVNIWGYDKSGKEAKTYIYTGEGQGVRFCMGLDREGDIASGEITYTYDPGNTGATFHPGLRSNDKKRISFEIHNPQRAGTIKVTYHYDGDDKYEAQDLRFTFTVREAEYIKLAVTGKDGKQYVLRWEHDDNGNDMLRLREKGSKNDDDSTKWVYESANDANYHYLYNEGQKRYLLVVEHKETAAATAPYYESYDYIPEGVQRGKFAIDDQHRIYSKKWQTTYLGIEDTWPVEDGRGIYSNKSAGAAYKWDIIHYK